jgi:zinc-binding alcohol dehydrogenase family protein
MKAVGFYRNLPITDDEALVDIALPEPQVGERDLFIQVKAISVNPADVKQRQNVPPAEGHAKVVGYDAVGTVIAVGSKATFFKPGDEVFYAGAVNRPGTYAEFHAVDERVVGRKPATLSDVEAAALPLTSLTAWELLFDRLRVPYGTKRSNDAILIINGAGGVGSILIQIARRLTGLTVIATASRPETADWCLEMGAHHVIDHRQPLRKGIESIGLQGVRYVASLTASDQHRDGILDILNPHGAMALIDDPASFDVMPFKRKSLSVHWELMFTPTLFHTPDMQEQHTILTEISALVDSGVLKTTLHQNLGVINAENLKKAHALLESGKGIGKTVLSGF